MVVPSSALLICSVLNLITSFPHLGHFSLIVASSARASYCSLSPEDKETIETSCRFRRRAEGNAEGFDRVTRVRSSYTGGLVSEDER